MCVKPKRRKAYRFGCCWYEKKKTLASVKKITHTLTPELSKGHTGDRFKLNKPRIRIFQKSQHFLFIAHNYLNFHSFWQLYSLFSLFFSLFIFTRFIVFVSSGCCHMLHCLCPKRVQKTRTSEKSLNFTVLFFHSFSVRLMPNPKQVVSIHFIDVTKQNKIASHPKRVEGAKRE